MNAFLFFVMLFCEKVSFPAITTVDVSLITPGNSTSFLLDLWKICILFLQHHLKFYVLNPSLSPQG